MHSSRTGFPLVLASAAALLLSSCTLIVPPNTPAGPTPDPRSRDPEAQFVAPQELVQNPAAFEGRKIWLQGEARNVGQAEESISASGSFPSFTWLRLLARGPAGAEAQSVAVQFSPREPSIQEGDCYRVYGVVVGVQDTPESIQDAPRKLPRLRGTGVDRIPKSGGSCPAP